MAKKHVHKRDLDHNRISDLYLKGNTLRAIAKIITEEHGQRISHVMVWKIVEELREEWRTTRTHGMEAAMAVELEKIDKVEAAAWDAWEASKHQSVTRTRKKGTPVSGQSIVSTTEVETTKTEQETPGDPRFLVVIHKCIDRRCRILGLYQQPEIRDDEDAPTAPHGQLPEQFSETPTFVIVGESKPMVSSEDDLPEYE